MRLIKAFVCLITLPVCYGGDDAGFDAEHDTRKGSGARHHLMKEIYKIKRFRIEPKPEIPKEFRRKPTRKMFTNMGRAAHLRGGRVSIDSGVFARDEDKE
jgi:hypothetical protein